MKQKIRLLNGFALFGFQFGRQGITARKQKRWVCHVRHQGGDKGVILDRRDPHLARQSPRDYVDGFVTSVRGAVAAGLLVAGDLMRIV